METNSEHNEYEPHQQPPYRGGSAMREPERVSARQVAEENVGRQQVRSARDELEQERQQYNSHVAYKKEANYPYEQRKPLRQQAPQSHRFSRRRRRLKWFLKRNSNYVGLVVVVLLVVGIAAGYRGYTHWQTTTSPVSVTINGEEYVIKGAERTIDGVLDAGLVSVEAGDYLAIDESVLEEGGGTRATAILNGEEQDDLAIRLNKGDVLELTDGVDVMEDYTESDVQTLEYDVEFSGSGAIHLYQGEGVDGEKIVRTGIDSGIEVDITVSEAVNETVVYYDADTGNDKVIALTFDDGPWDTYTEEILDILAKYDAKATFFTVGYCIEGHEDLIERMVEEGHQVSTHTYDHAEGSGNGVSLILMSSDERQEEVLKGRSAIGEVIEDEPSTIFRAPGGNFDESVAADLKYLVTAEIGWDIDTQDWKKPGADTIAERILEAESGDIVLMHDGGGDRSQTVEALETALPKLIKEGYSFITVEDLIEQYPYEEE